MFGSRSLHSSATPLVIAFLMGGCVIPKLVGDDPNGGDGNSTGGSSTAAEETNPSAGAISTSGASGGALETTGDPDPSGGTDPGGSDETGRFFIHPVDGGIFDPCDPWAQNCPPGEKCTPWSSDGDYAWDTFRCGPVVEDPDAVGEPCTVESSPVSGFDSCDFGAMCWEVDLETLEGTCVAHCTGSEDVPTCPTPNTTCLIANDGVLTLCLPSCDPLLQDCASGGACYPATDGFVCLPDAWGGAGEPGDSCEGIATCAHGNVCVVPELVPDCASTFGCCTAFCDLGEPMPPCQPGQVCTPWFELGMAPVGYEDVGYCALPA